jgi:methyl-accepting chemotaxis protein
VRLFRQLRFTAKALILSAAFGAPLLGLMTWLIVGQHDQALAARKASAREHVQIAHAYLVHAHAQERAGRQTREQAQAAARAAIGAMRYGDSGYFWINDMRPRLVMHPFEPELEGQDVSGMKDPNGLALFQAFMETVRRQGSGFVDYQWPKPGHAQPADMVSFVQGFEPWGWVIGTGLSIDDLHDAQAARMDWALAALAVAFTVAAYLAISYHRVMNGGLRETEHHLRALARGDLTTLPQPWGRDEAAHLMLEMRRTQEAVRGIVARMRDSSRAIASTSDEIARGAGDLSSRTEASAVNRHHPASSMEQVSAPEHGTTSHTEEATRMAGDNARRATDGGRVMRQVVDTMEAIRDSAARIGDILGTIDGMAFQTDLLALNAAIEAARAGDQGRGLAVVAAEVRTLAQRSAEAAREIKSLIGHSVQEVEARVGVVRVAGSTIEEIVAASQRVSALLGSVATEAAGQSVGVSQIGAAVQALERMTQHNAALVEHTATAAAAMREQALALAQEVAHFRLPGDPPPASAG